MIDGEIVIPDGDGARLDFEALLQRIHPAASRVNAAGRPDPGPLRGLRPAGPGGHRLPGAAVRRAPGGAGGRPGRGAGAAARHPGDHRPRPGRAVVRPVRGRRAGRAHRQAAGRRRTSPTSGSCSRSSTSAPPTAWSPATGRTRPATEAIGSLLLGLYTDDGKLASVGVVGAFPMAQRRRAVHRDAAAGHHVRGAPVELGQAGGRRARRGRPRSAAGTRARTCRSSRCAPSGWSRCATTTWRAAGSGTPTQFVRWRPDRDPRSCTYEQLEEPVSFDLGDILG